MWIIQRKFNTEEWENLPESYNTRSKASQALIAEEKENGASFIKYRLLKCEVLDD